MDLKQLQYFVASVDNGSFKKAAEVLYTSQPHISKTIKSLETELQVDLLSRKARGVEATEAGKKVYEYACRVLTEAGRIQKVRETWDSHVLRIASACSGDRLSDLILQFCVGEIPGGLHSEYLEYTPEELLRAIHRHKADLGYTCVEERQMTGFRQALEQKHLEFQELGRTGPRLLVGPKSPLYHAVSVTNRELRELDYVQSREDQELLSIGLIQGNEDYRYYGRYRQALVTDSRYLMTQMLLRTELCSISCGIAPELEGCGEIREIPVKGLERSIAFGYIKRRRDPLSPEAERLVKFIEMQLNTGRD